MVSSFSSKFATDQTTNDATQLPKAESSSSTLNTVTTTSAIEPTSDGGTTRDAFPYDAVQPIVLGLTLNFTTKTNILNIGNNLLLSSPHFTEASTNPTNRPLESLSQATMSARPSVFPIKW